MGPIYMEFIKDEHNQKFEEMVKSKVKTERKGLYLQVDDWMN